MGNPYAPPGENARPTPAPPAAEQPAAEQPGPGQPVSGQPGSGHSAAGQSGSDQPGPGRPSPDNPASGRPADRPGSDRWPGALHPAPPPTPPRPPVSPEVTKATARRALHFFALLLAAVVTSSLPLPLQVGSLLFVLVAIVVGVRTLVMAWRAGVRGGVLFALASGVAMAGMVALAMTLLLALWPQQMELQRCRASAVTISATQQCETEFQESIERLAPQRRAPAS